MHVRPTKQQRPGNEVTKKVKLILGPAPTSTEDPQINKPNALREGKYSEP